MHRQKGELPLPVAIIISGVIIAGAIIFTQTNSGAIDRAANPGDQNGSSETTSLDAMRKITKDDHIRGSIDAPIKIVEYSDYECPFCARVHTTIETVMSEYGDDVAWVYRQFPLTDIERGFHVNAKRAAEAAECVADLAGNDAFWTFTDEIFATTKARSDELYTSLAAPLGVSGEELISCIDSGKFTKKVEEDIANAAETGGRGTPWIIVEGPDGTRLPINGAQPIEVFRAVIDQLI